MWSEAEALFIAIAIAAGGAAVMAAICAAAYFF